MAAGFTTVQTCRLCGRSFDTWEEPYLHHPDGSYQHLLPCPLKQGRGRKREDPIDGATEG